MSIKQQTIDLVYVSQTHMPAYNPDIQNQVHSK